MPSPTRKRSRSRSQSKSRSRSRSQSRSNRSRSRSFIPDAQLQDYSPITFNNILEDIRYNSVYSPNKKSPPKTPELDEVKQNLDEVKFKKLMKKIPEQRLKNVMRDGAQEEEYYIPPLNKNKKQKR